MKKDNSVYKSVKQIGNIFFSLFLWCFFKKERYVYIEK